MRILCEDKCRLDFHWLLECSIRFKDVTFPYQANCDVDATTFDGNTPLHIAAASGLKGQTALLVAAGADTTLQNSDEETAFDLANVAEVSVFNPI